jgi:H+/Cl- antiporter ClcA
MYEKRQLMMLTGVGSLLVAFFGSLIPAVVPLMLLRQSKKLSVGRAATVFVAAVGTYLTVWSIKGKVHGWGGVPVSLHFGFKDYLLAFALGVLTAWAAASLHGLIRKLSPLAMAIYARTHWLLAAAIFGGVIGVLYLVGGQSVQFNGSVGTDMLVHHRAEYGALAFAGLVILKIVLTAWSLAAGYRGGIVFPSVYTGVALSLLVGSIAGSFDGTGTTVGAIAGIFAALTTPALGFVMLVSLLPFKLIGLALAGVLGAVAAPKLLSVGAKRRASPTN